jgi:hypothetical protein
MPECGCHIKAVSRIVYCPLHAAAGAMREALEQIDDTRRGSNLKGDCSEFAVWTRNIAKAALAQAEGQTK